MKKLLALIVICLAFTPLVVRAEDWVLVSKSEKLVSYIDVDSIKMSNGKVYFWYLWNYSPHLPGFPDTLSSKFFISILDCDLFSYQGLRNVDFSEYFGDGTVTSVHDENQPVVYAIPGSVMGITVKSACDFIKR